jgi:hypothetical protein
VAVYPKSRFVQEETIVEYVPTTYEVPKEDSDLEQVISIARELISLLHCLESSSVACSRDSFPNSIISVNSPWYITESSKSSTQMGDSRLPLRLTLR